jgi:DnaJ-class molecular chaperone
MQRDLYEVLGVRRDASAEDIRLAYGLLVAAHQGDLWASPRDTTPKPPPREVQYAYEVLSDRTRREQYDRHGFAALEGDFDPEMVNLLKQFGVFPPGRRSGATWIDRTEETIPAEAAARGGVLTLRVNDMEITVKIPAGIKDGQWLRLSGVGPSGEDLYVRLRVR